MPTFPAETVQAVLDHMNSDHNDDNLLIARAFGDADATSATMTTLDGDGGTWHYRTTGDPVELHVAWSEPISERAEIRREIVVLHTRASEKLGIAPAQH